MATLAENPHCFSSGRIDEKSRFRSKCLFAAQSVKSPVGVEKLSDWTDLVRAGVVLRFVFLLSGDS
jgi:hypothetical protein